MKGIYTIVTRLKNPAKCRVGALGPLRFERGLYVYTGSARGNGSTSVERRIERHLGKRVRNFWHIDYFLGMRACEVQAVVYSETERDLECAANRQIRQLIHAAFPIKHFGSSDCGCPSHLLHPRSSEVDEVLSKVRTAYGKLNLKPSLRRTARSAWPLPISCRKRRRTPE